MTDGWKERAKNVNSLIAKRIVLIVEEIMENFGLSERTSYGCIGEYATEHKYECVDVSKSEELSTMSENLNILNSTKDILSDEISDVEEKINFLKREELKTNRMFENIKWQLRPMDKILNMLYVDAIVKDADDNLLSQLDYFFSTWGGNKDIYKFEDGRTLDCSYDRDDWSLTISFNVTTFSIKEIKKAFTELNVNILLDKFENYVDDKKEIMQKYSEIIKLFK